VKRFWPGLGRLLMTLAMVAVAGFGGWSLWVYYMDAPWTRDGRVRADVVGITPDVSGLVSEVLVHDNQRVSKGDVLFRVDTARFELALRQFEALLASRLAAMQEAVREARRYGSLSDLSVSLERQQQPQAAQEQAIAAYQQATADRDLARLNLQRATVTAPLNGTVTNFDLQRGDYVTAGRAVFALVATDTLHVSGYFEETKLPRIHIGDRARMRLLGGNAELYGTVHSIAGAIEDRDRTTDPGSLLANVNPTFAWVRLAQRVPVRITLDKVPEGLIAGSTVSVEILPR
jgi:RND family efflux transporter MFP subunit